MVGIIVVILVIIGIRAIWSDIRFFLPRKAQKTKWVRDPKSGIRHRVPDED